MAGPIARLAEAKAASRGGKAARCFGDLVKVSGQQGMAAPEEVAQAPKKKTWLLLYSLSLAVSGNKVNTWPAAVENKQSICTPRGTPERLTK